jgi:hypothetical protein
VKRIITIASAALIAVGTGAYGLAASASASTGPRPAVSRMEHFELVTTSVGPTGVKFHAIYYGVFIAAGTEVSGSGNTDTVHMHGGTFKLTHTSTPNFKVNPTTCLATATGKAKYKIHGGTGRFTGIRGRGTATISELGILGRSHGACTENAAPVAIFIVVKGSGPLHL